MAGRRPARLGLLPEETQSALGFPRAGSHSPVISRAQSPAATPTMRKRESAPALCALDAAENGQQNSGGREKMQPPSPLSDSLRSSGVWLELEPPLPLRAHLEEVGGFLAWAAAIAVLLAQYPLVWVSFWEHVSGIGGNDNELLAPRRHTLAPLWVLWVLLLYCYRQVLYARAIISSASATGGPIGVTAAATATATAFGSDASMASVLAHGEVFICVGVAMTLCVNFASYVHTPGPRLFDVGFLLIPEQARDSPWRPASDILTAALPVIALARGLLLGRRQRCRLVAAWFRLISIVYAFRCLSVTLTSLPGPAPHCEAYEGYGPPRCWHDIATRMGPMVGDFKTCGDLLFSGHAALSTVTLLLLVKSLSLRGNSVLPHQLRLCKLLSAAYLLTLCTLAVAGRKHYTVDIVLGVLVAALAFFRFENGWSAQANGGGGGSGIGSGSGGAGGGVGSIGRHEKKMEGLLCA